MNGNKTQKFNKNKSDRPPKPPGVGKRIRDIERLLKGRGDKLPAEVKEAKEKELEDLKSQFKDKQVKARSDKFSAKYKMVRFLERKKIMKIEAKLNKAIATLEAKADQLTAEEKQQLTKHKEDLKKANNDMAYVMHFPSHLKYISLFPKAPMTNERILKLQASIREDLMKKKEAGELKDKDATMDVTEEIFAEENGNADKAPKQKTTTATPKANTPNAKPAKSDNAVAKNAQKAAPKEQKPKGSFQRPEDAAEKAPKKPAKKERDSFFMGDEAEKPKEVAKKDDKKPVKEEKKKDSDKMQVEVKKEKAAKKKSEESSDSSSSDDDKSDNENQEYVKGGKSSSEDSSDDSSEDSSSEEKQPANKKRKASAADLETSKHKNKKQKK